MLVLLTNAWNNKIEMALCAAMKCGAEPAATRLSELLSLTCAIFHCDGCIFTHPEDKNTGLTQLLHRLSKTSGFPTERIQILLGACCANQKPALLLDPISDGVSAIIARGTAIHLLLYREQHQTFSEQDAQLVGALWRAGTTTTLLCQVDSQKVPFVRELSPRVRQVLGFVLDGFAEKEIAGRLRLSKHTVHVYVKTLYRQMGVNSKSELLRQCLGHSMLPTKPNRSVHSRRHDLLPGVLQIKPKGGQIKPTDEIITPLRPIPFADSSDARTLFGQAQSTD